MLLEDVRGDRSFGPGPAGLAVALEHQVALVAELADADAAALLVVRGFRAVSRDMYESRVQGEKFGYDKVLARVGDEHGER